MVDTKGILERISQHNKLKIRISTHTNSLLPKDIYEKLIKPHRITNYFFIFLTKGQTIHTIDLKDIAISENHLLFVLPHQIHMVPRKNSGCEYFKLSFDAECLALLPRQFHFLSDPLTRQCIPFADEETKRVKSLFQILSDLLHNRNNENDVELILANLNSLLTQFSHSYFKNTRPSEDINGNLSAFIRFKNIVEADLTEQPSVSLLAEKLSLTPNRLYGIVKSYTGLSPKVFLINRLILEAQRKLYYSETSVKELAYDLGFSDPDYFSRLFKKYAGKSITRFYNDLQNLAGN